MRRVMILNAKGGAGKTMLATNLASYLTSNHKSVAIADMDPQGSSLAWLAARPEDRRPIQGIDGIDGPVRAPKHTDFLIIDTPASVYGKDLTALVRRAETILIPVQPSATDMRAAAKFIDELLDVGKISRKEVKLALVANRMREAGRTAGFMERLLQSVHIPFATQSTEINETLENFLKGMKIPLVAEIHDSESYLLADSQGLGIFELDSSDAERDVETWKPLIQWLESRRSIPRIRKKS
ncbi:MAG: ParA family protein [Acidiferrobacterales bacterium]|jgi:chromosome partitioning protein|nr:ParA family protein [Acidiferrobacterales bacterium]